MRLAKLHSLAFAPRPHRVRRNLQRILAHRDRIFAEQEAENRAKMMADAKVRLEESLALPGGVTLDDANSRMDDLFVKYSAAGKGLAGQVSAGIRRRCRI